MRTPARVWLFAMLSLYAVTAHVDIETPWAEERSWDAQDPTQEDPTNVVSEFESDLLGGRMYETTAKKPYEQKAKFTHQQISDAKATAKAAEDAYDAERGADAIAGQTSYPLKRIKAEADAEVMRMRHKAKLLSKDHGATKRVKSMAVKTAKKIMSRPKAKAKKARQSEASDMKKVSAAMKEHQEKHSKNSAAREKARQQHMKKLDKKLFAGKPVIKAKAKATPSPTPTSRTFRFSGKVSTSKNSVADAQRAIQKAARKAVSKALEKATRAGAGAGEQASKARTDAARAVAKVAKGLKSSLLLSLAKGKEPKKPPTDPKKLEEGAKKIKHKVKKAEKEAAAEANKVVKEAAKEAHKVKKEQKKVQKKAKKKAKKAIKAIDKAEAQKAKANASLDKNAAKLEHAKKAMQKGLTRKNGKHCPCPAPHKCFCLHPPSHLFKKHSLRVLKNAAHLLPHTHRHLTPGAHHTKNGVKNPPKDPKKAHMKHMKIKIMQKGEPHLKAPPAKPPVMEPQYKDGYEGLPMSGHHKKAPKAVHHHKKKTKKAKKKVSFKKIGEPAVTGDKVFHEPEEGPWKGGNEKYTLTPPWKQDSPFGGAKSAKKPAAKKAKKKELMLKTSPAAAMQDDILANLANMKALDKKYPEYNRTPNHKFVPVIRHAPVGRPRNVKHTKEHRHKRAAAAKARAAKKHAQLTKRVEGRLTGIAAVTRAAQDKKARKAAQQAVVKAAKARLKQWHKANHDAWKWAKAKTSASKKHDKGWKPFRKHSSPGVAHVSHASLKAATKRLLTPNEPTKSFGEYDDKSVLVKEIAHKGRSRDLAEGDSFYDD